jgi:hypothetical protein
MRVDACPDHLPAWVSANEPVADSVLAVVELEWRPAGTSAWLGCRAGVEELCDILRDCGAIEVRQPGVADGRSAMAMPVGAGWGVQIRASSADGVVEQVGALGAAQVGPRGRVDAANWARPVFTGPGWVVRRLRAADTLGQWVGAAAVPSLTTTTFLAPEPAR